MPLKRMNHLGLAYPKREHLLKLPRHDNRCEQQVSTHDGLTAIDNWPMSLLNPLPHRHPSTGCNKQAGGKLYGTPTSHQQRTYEKKSETNISKVKQVKGKTTQQDYVAFDPQTDQADLVNLVIDMEQQSGSGDTPIYVTGTNWPMNKSPPTYLLSPQASVPYQ